MRPPPGQPAKATTERATIGPSITVKGEVGGDEDLLIQGRVEGSVNLKQQSVTVGNQGRVKADIEGKVVTIEGEVEGDLKALEQVILKGSARVQGDITAPRVVLEDGASFRGLIDMGDPFGDGSTSSGDTTRDASSSKAGEPSGGAKKSGSTEGSTVSPAGLEHSEKSSSDGKKGASESEVKVGGSPAKSPV
jgi:cytoskeletal protein CcmA (bactofilin family)